MTRRNLIGYDVAFIPTDGFGGSFLIIVLRSKHVSIIDRPCAIVAILGCDISVQRVKRRKSAFLKQQIAEIIENPKIRGRDVRC